MSAFSALQQRHESNRRDEILKNHFAKINIREQILGINAEYDSSVAAVKKQKEQWEKREPKRTSSSYYESKTEIRLKKSLY
jgi:hypothetical protein